MIGLTTLDLVAVLGFFICWKGYSWSADYGPLQHTSIDTAMNHHRRRWIRTMLGRELRVIDTTIVANLINGVGFFASTTILIIGGLLAMLGAGDLAVRTLAALPYETTTTLTLWQIKILLLLVIFIHAFFKFAWSLRLTNYCSTLIGGAPYPPLEEDVIERYSTNVAELANLAGLHMNRGVRSYFFGLAAISWIYHPALLIVATLWVTVTVYRREFRSRARTAICAVLKE